MTPFDIGVSYIDGTLRQMDRFEADIARCRHSSIFGATIDSAGQCWQCQDYPDRDVDYWQAYEDALHRQFLRDSQDMERWAREEGLVA